MMFSSSIKQTATVVKWHGIFYMRSCIDMAGHTKAFDYMILGLLHNFGDGCRGQNRGRDGRGTATGGPR